MADLLAGMEASGLAAWVRESPSLWAYPAILTLHSIGLGIVVGASAIVDVRILGGARAIPLPDLAGLFPIIWWAFAVNALSGALLFIADATRKGSQPVFAVKLACIALAVVITWRLQATVTNEGAGAAGGARVLAGLSVALWLGAIAAGRLMAYL